VLPWQAPDEPRHFEHVRLIYEQGRTVSGRDVSPMVEREIISSMDSFNYWALGRLIYPQFKPGTLPDSFKEIWFPGQYGPDEPNMAHALHQPPLYYLFLGLSLRVLGIHDLITQLYMSRLLSLVIATLVVLVAYLTVRELFAADYHLQVAVPVFIVLLPMHTFITSAVMNDVLAELLASVLIYLLTVMFAHGFKLSHAVLIPSILLLGQFTKRTFLFTLPLTLFAMILIGIVRLTKHQLWQKTCVAAAILAPIVGGLGWWQRAVLKTWWQKLPLPLVNINVTGAVDEFLAHPDRYVWSLFKSFWGWFGWMRVEMDAIWYAILLLLCLAAGLGVLRVIWRSLLGQANLESWQGAVLLLYGLAIASVYLASIGSAVLDNLGQPWVIFLPQGRYLFPVIIPITVLFFLGLHEWIQPRHQRIWLMAILGFLVFFDMIALMGYIIPFFYS